VPKEKRKIDRNSTVAVIGFLIFFWYEHYLHHRVIRLQSRVYPTIWRCCFEQSINLGKVQENQRASH